MSTTQSMAVGPGGATSTTAVAEGVGGIVAIVLTSLGLAHVAPVFLVAVATIAAGVALLAQGAMIAGEYLRILTARGEPLIAVGGSFTWSIQVLAGAAAVILGILALLAVVPVTLVAIAVIAIGAGLVLGSGAAATVALLRLPVMGVDDPRRRIVNESVSGAAMVQALTGLTAIVLGILSLAGFSSVPLILIALLAAGAYFVINSSTFGGLMVSVFRS